LNVIVFINISNWIKYAKEIKKFYIISENQIIGYIFEKKKLQILKWKSFTLQICKKDYTYEFDWNGNSEEHKCQVIMFLQNICVM